MQAPGTDLQLLRDVISTVRNGSLGFHTCLQLMLVVAALHCQPCSVCVACAVDLANLCFIQLDVAVEVAGRDSVVSLRGPGWLIQSGGTKFEHGCQVQNDSLENLKHQESTCLPCSQFES